MRPFTRIAVILLGAVALGLVVLIAWPLVVVEFADLRDRVRRSACTWVDPLVVSVAGHELSVPATPQTTVFTGTVWRHAEEVSGYRAARLRYGFCFEAPPDGPVAAQAVTIAFEPARVLADRAGLPQVEGQMLEIAEAAMFLPDAPPVLVGGDRMVVFARDTEYGWPRMASEGVGADGLRIGAVCRDGTGDGWYCDVSALDVPAGLSYRFARLPVTQETFDGQPVPAPFRQVATGMRTVAKLLEDDALASR